MKKFAQGFLIIASIALIAAGCNKTEDTTNTSNTNMEEQSSKSNTTPNTDSSTNTPAATGQTKTFTVNGDNFKFAPAELRVNEGDTVVINFKNTGGFHDWVLDEFANAKTKQLADGASETITFVANKKGTFEYYCSVGKHREMGMKGNLIVE